MSFTGDSKITTLDMLLSMSDAELIQLRPQLDAEMRKRKIAFSVDDIGERLAIEYLRARPGLPNLTRTY
jgi:hypothetical protein